MSDAPAKKRQWFQLHLSTCVVLLVVAGVLAWANFENRHYTFDGLSMRNGVAYCGWPFPMTAVSYVHFPDDDRNVSIGNRSIEISGPIDENEIGGGPHLFVLMAFNIAVAVAILAAIARACEFLISRRERMRAEAGA